MDDSGCNCLTCRSEPRSRTDAPLRASTHASSAALPPTKVQSDRDAPEPSPVAQQQLEPAVAPLEMRHSLSWAHPPEVTSRATAGKVSGSAWVRSRRRLRPTASLSRRLLTCLSQQCMVGSGRSECISTPARRTEHCPKLLDYCRHSVRIQSLYQRKTSCFNHAPAAMHLTPCTWWHA